MKMNRSFTSHTLKAMKENWSEIINLDIIL